MSGRKKQTAILEIISGKRNGVTATLVRTLLSGLTPLYRTGVGIRNLCFDRGWFPAGHVNVPVISVGNLTTGGTGKTPLIIFMARLLKQRGLNPVIISRGYGKLDDGVRNDGVRNDGVRNDEARNDEALEIESRLPGIVHLQNPDRRRIAREAITIHQADVVLMDDGFQHRRLHRDLDVVLVDALCPFGFERLLPRGLLREPARNLARADLVLITRCENIRDEELERLKRRIVRLNSSAPLATVRSRHNGWLDRSGNRHDQLPDRSVLAFCGIGNPDAFFQGLDAAGVSIVERLPFPDHHHYSTADLKTIADRADAAGVRTVVCTHKDLVKISDPASDRLAANGISLLAMLIDVEFTSGEKEFEAAVLSACADSGKA